VFIIYIYIHLNEEMNSYCKLSHFKVFTHLRDGRKLMLGSHDSDLWTAENADQVGT
jgi:hypothetical protein